MSRQELNRRFKNVYQLLVDQGQIVKNSRQKSKSIFAANIGTKGHIVDLFLEDKRTITYEQAKKLCTTYGVSEAYMFQGIGTAFEQPKLPPEERLAMALGINFSPNILFTNIEAFASNTIGVDLLEESERFSLPGLFGDLVAFNINGDSMSPTILAGDMVICTPLEEVTDMVEDEVYAVVSNRSVWVKRVRRCFDSTGCWTHLKLISDNAIEFDPFTIELNEVRKLLKVKRRLTGMG